MIYLKSTLIHTVVKVRMGQDFSSLCVVV